MNALEGSKTAAKLSSGDIATNATHQPCALSPLLPLAQTRLLRLH